MNKESEEVEIRICYYTNQKRNSEFWNIAPRPLVVSMEESEYVEKAIRELREIYHAIKGSS